MVHFVALLQSAQNRDGILHRRLIDQHRLEPSFQRGILLNMFPILIQRRRADQVQFATGQHGLEQIGGIHGPFRRARSHYRM